MYYFYKEVRKDLRVLFISNWSYYATSLLKQALNTFNVVNPVLMSKNSKEDKQYEWYVRLLWSFLQILQIVSIVVFWYLNSKNIHFKAYIYIYMRGQYIEKHFPTLSMFVCKSCWFSKKVGVEPEYENSFEESTRDAILRHRAEFEQTVLNLNQQETSIDEKIYFSINKEDRDLSLIDTDNTISK